MYKSLRQLIALFKSPVSPVTQGNSRLILFATAVKALGTDASPHDVAPDEYGCAETVWDVLDSTGLPNDIPFTVSTNQLYKGLLASKYFIKVDQPLEGDILISPTGYGNGNLSNGHVGIIGQLPAIMSNSSATGKFEENYTLDTWKARYVDIGGYPMAYFRRV